MPSTRTLLLPIPSSRGLESPALPQAYTGSYSCTHSSSIPLSPKGTQRPSWQPEGAARPSPSYTHYRWIRETVVLKAAWMSATEQVETTSCLCAWSCSLTYCQGRGLWISTCPGPTPFGMEHSTSWAERSSIPTSGQKAERGHAACLDPRSFSSATKPASAASSPQSPVPAGGVQHLTWGIQQSPEHCGMSTNQLHKARSLSLLGLLWVSCSEDPATSAYGR